MEWLDAQRRRHEPLTPKTGTQLRKHGGEVLVCPTTSAAWTMVFRRAGAIVVDTDSVLSHTALVDGEEVALYASQAEQVRLVGVDDLSILLQ